MREFTAEHKIRRQNKFAQLIREEISSILRREVKDPRLELLTVTEVDLNPDLKSAIIYVSPLNPPEENSSEEKKKDLLKGLKSASHFVYERLKKRLSLRVIPSIRFEYDVRWYQASRVWNVLGDKS